MQVISEADETVMIRRGGAIPIPEKEIIWSDIQEMPRTLFEITITNMDQILEIIADQGKDAAAIIRNAAIPSGNNTIPCHNHLLNRRIQPSLLYKNNMRSMKTKMIL